MAKVLRQQAPGVLACDFLIVETAFLRRVYALFFTLTITTVQQLADYMNIPEKRLRGLLRKEYPAKAPGQGDQWTLTPEMNRHMAELVRGHP